MSRTSFQAGVAGSKKTLIDAETTIKGDIEGSIELTLRGVVLGDVDVVFLLMEAGSRLEGAIIAETAVIRGRVVGSVRATRVSLSSEAEVEGEIVCETLEVEAGARLIGRSTFSGTSGYSAPISQQPGLKPTLARARTLTQTAEGELGLLAIADRVNRIAR